jgi:hypothetical protein
MTIGAASVSAAQVGAVAKAIGVAVPPMFVAVADEVNE